MASPANSQTQKQLIDYKFDEVFKRLDRMEGKMDGFAFVKQSDYELFKKEIRETYATKEEVKPMKTLFWAIVTASAVAIVGILAGRFTK